MGVYFAPGGAQRLHAPQIQIENRGAAGFHQRGVQLEHAAHRPAAPEDLGGARRVLERARLGGLRLRAGHQAFGRALDLEQAGRAIALAVVDSGRQVRNFLGQARRARG